jgi:Alpha-L-arabinofuranosidase B, catalytic
MKLDKVTRYMVRCTVIYLIKKFNIPHQEPVLTQTLTNLAANLSIEGYVNAVATIEANLSSSLEGTVEVTSTLDVSEALILNQVLGAAAAYSLRQLSTTYTGPLIRVRRTDNQELDIYGTPAGLDTASLLTFVGSGNGFVTVWYDQSGNNRHATQTTAANQPLIVLNGILQQDLSKPSITFTGTQSFVTTTTTAAFNFVHNGSPATITVVGRPGNINDPNAIYPILSNADLTSTNVGFTLAYEDRTTAPINNSVRTLIYRGVSSNPTVDYFPANTYTPNQVNTLTVQIDADSTDRVKIYRNFDPVVTSSGFTNAPSTANASLSLKIGNAATSFYVGSLQEVIIFNTTANQTTIANDTYDYYNLNQLWTGQLTSLLDDYPNAAAAYSLRALRSGYTGPVIRVRRSSDNAEADINLLSTGVLDEQRLLSFCTTSDGFVKTWYDQSTNNYTVSQNANGSQPTIVVGGIIQKSPTNKPTIVFSTGKNLSSITFSISSIPRTVFLVQSYNIATGYPYVAQDGFSDRGVLYTSSGSRQQVYNGSTFTYSPTVIQLNKNYLWYVLLNSTSTQMNLNNDGLITGQAGSDAANRIFFGTLYNGTISEYINYFNNQSVNQANIRSNINSHYNIY